MYGLSVMDMKAAGDTSAPAVAASYALLTSTGSYQGVREHNEGNSIRSSILYLCLSMSRLLYITPTGKANNHTRQDILLTLRTLAIEARARLIKKQLSLISRIHPQKLENHIINHSIWIRLLRNSIEHHHRAVNKLRFRLAKESGFLEQTDIADVIRTTRQDGDILVPVFLLSTRSSSEFSERTEPHSSTDHGLSTSDESSEGRASVDREHCA